MDGFDIKADIPNQVYLETQLSKIVRMQTIYKTQAKDTSLSSRQRARARDLEQAANGLVNGIKFSISFWLHKNEDLMEMEDVVGEPAVKTIN